MASLKKALPENVDGRFYVDSSCINCGVSRNYASGIFGDTGEFAYVKKQPETDDEVLAAEQALLACPVAAIGTRHKLDLTPARNAFPLQMTDNVFLNGFNHRKSYGAHSYFIRATFGNWLIDSPRFLPWLVERFEAMGGIRYIFLTHADDVADAHKYASHFNAARIVHVLEAHAQKDAEMILEGEDTYPIDSGEIYFTPGHTAGHLVLLWEKRYLFTGDHYAYIPRLHRFGSFRDACWYSWETQIESVRKMADFTGVEWVFPGHGKWHTVQAGKFPEIVRKSVEWMEKQR